MRKHSNRATRMLSVAFVGLLALGGVAATGAAAGAATKSASSTALVSESLLKFPCSPLTVDCRDDVQVEIAEQRPSAQSCVELVSLPPHPDIASTAATTAGRSRRVLMPQR